MHEFQLKFSLKCEAQPLTVVCGDIHLDRESVFSLPPNYFRFTAKTDRRSIQWDLRNRVRNAMCAKRVANYKRISPPDEHLRFCLLFSPKSESSK